MNIPNRNNIFLWLSKQKDASSGILTLYIILSVISLILVDSAMVSEVYKYGNDSVFTLKPIIKHLVLLILGGLVILFLPNIFLKLNRKVKTLTILVYLVVTCMATILVPFIGTSINHARRWYMIAGVSIQPTDFMKLAIIIIGAYLGSVANSISTKDGNKYYNYNNKQRNTIFYIFWGITILIILPVTFSNLSIGLIFIVFVLLFFSPIMQASWKKILRTIMYLGIIMLLGYAVIKIFNIPINRLATWEQRFHNMVTKQENPYEINDSNRQKQFSRIALANGDIFGKGMNNSKMKNMLPQAYSDYIMSVAYEEYGIFSVIIISFIFLYWIAVARGIARKSSDLFCRYIAYGIGIVYPIQVVINFAVSSGIIVTGQPLPIIGRGGSSILGTSLSLAALIIISRINENKNNLETNDK